jgi:hypothetical protein
MPKVKKITGMAPLPQYIMPDYYIRAGDECNYLCRIVHGGGKVFFHELVDHHKHGISEEDIEESVKKDTGTFTLPGLFPISPHIEQKLRILYDI